MFLTSHFIDSATEATYGQDYPSIALRYYPPGTYPGYIPAGSTGMGFGWFSVTAWVAGSGLLNYYNLNCSSTLWQVGVGGESTPGGSWLGPGQVGAWGVGGAGNANTCSPFALLVMTSSPRPAFGVTMTVTG